MKENKTAVFDVRTLLLLDILIMIFMLISGKPEVTLSAFMLAAAVPVITGLYGVLLCYALLFAGLFVYYQFIFHSAIQGFHSAVFSVIGVFSFIVQRIIPFMLLGTVIQKQKNISEITTALERMHLPKGIILSIAVMFRYVPSIKDDLFIIIDAMKLKGLYTSKRAALIHPIRTMEFVLVPMLFKSLKTAEELSCTALVKGIENTGKKTSYFDVRLRVADVVFLLTAITLLTASANIKLF
ncbi:energy-coupling factor transporter transmembrane protein EcfT [Treponema sp. OMZ 305]|uniref:energy-coupling factor transporter transmembrane component T n=1 Tax=Treponema TaxID=157 RepID=UPI001BAE6BD9|nr:MULTISPECIES: energy-coupling factor transporter transmembrane component T [Treponema]QUY17701.1 energy-coupling factor transporter transmembrane protein EcfT [Treponema vincentii]UTC57579.1 energy-coupling factor transporter transmembrane protein EcfT [Treponema sp. OMZ 305]